MSVHVHCVELLHLFLTGLLLHVLEHLVSNVLGKDGEQQTLLLDDITNSYNTKFEWIFLLFYSD